MGHHVIDVLHIFLGDRNPFRLGGGAGSGGIHQRLARYEHIRFAVLVPFDVWPETFIFRGLYAFFIEPEKLFRLAGLYDCAEVVLFAIGGILRQVQDFSEGSCTGLLRIAGGSCKGHPSGERHYCKPQIDELVWYSHTFSFLLGSSCNKVSISLKKSNI